jgi:hypothetical protein
MGVAVFAGEHLVYFGVKSFPGKKTEKKLMRLAAECVERLIARYKPDGMAIEEPYYVQARLCGPLLKLTSHLRMLARRHRMRVTSLPPPEVKRYFCVSKPTRRNLAQAMAQRYGYLSNFLREHRTWIYWQQMFDAVGLGAFVASRTRWHNRSPRISSGYQGFLSTATNKPYETPGLLRLRFLDTDRPVGASRCQGGKHPLPLG